MLKTVLERAGQIPGIRFLYLRQLGTGRPFPRPALIIRRQQVGSYGCGRRAKARESG